MNASAVIQVLREALPDVEAVDLGATDMPAIGIGRNDLLAVFKILRDHPSLQFALLVELTATDRLPLSPRFEIVYHLACLGEAYKTADVAAPPARLRVKVALSGDDARISTLTGLYPAAGWLEREVFDLFGVLFDAHPDLRRILTPEDWEGYPLRKDYPVQIRKDTAAWSPIQLTAEEFAANIRAERERAWKQSEGRAPAGGPGMQTDADIVRRAFEDGAALHAKVAAERSEVILRAAAVIRAALKGGRKVLVFGNGGSAADAQHFAAELVGRFGHHVERPAWPVIALVSDPAVVSAVANDFGFSAVFARQVAAFGSAGDVALALTTSGASANVNEGLRWALDRSLTTVALTGRDGGESGRLADVHVNVPDANPQRVQEVHKTILHVMCELVERDA